MSRFKSFLFGGLIGAGVALAFAPRTGEETRALVAEKINALAGEAQDFAAGMPGTAQDALKNAYEQGTAFVTDATDKAKGVVGAADETDADELRQKIEAARQRIAAQVMENAEKAQEAADETATTVVETVDVSKVETEEKADEAKHAK